MGASGALGGAAEPLIFNYLNYREFLRDFYQYKKSLNERYSYSVFSLKAGLKSPNTLALVISGSRNVTSNSVLAFARALGLDELETMYWEHLVAFNQARTETQKNYYLAKLAHSPLPRGTSGTSPIREIKDEWDYFSGWHHAAIRELVLFKDFDEEPTVIARRFKGRITAEQARESLALLERLKFLVRDESGRLRQAERIVRFASREREQIQTLMIRRFHRSTSELALQSLDQDDVSERDFSGLTLGVNADDVPKIKEKLTAFRKQLNQEFSQAGTADHVLQINLQVIPVTGRRKTL